jgi:hypothetical protein
MTEIFGSGAGYTLTKEAKLAFLNGVFQVFATRVAGSASAPASTVLKGSKRRDAIKLHAKVPGEAGNNIKVIVMRGSADETARMEISDGQTNETYDNLTMDPTNDLFLIKVLNENSKLVSAESVVETPSTEFNPWPTETKLEGGSLAPPNKGDYERALEALESEPDIDVVYACDSWDAEIHALVDAHCQNMSLGTEPKPLGPRIGIGTVRPNEPVEDIMKRTEQLASDRFVFVAPYGFAGAVAGLISKLSYYESPTFKPLTGMTWPVTENRYTPSQQMRLLRNGVIPIDAVRGRGIIVVKGISSSKEQISVMRVADHAVRGIKNVADNFIGTLNNARGRMALRERLTEFLIGMEREGSIVPSTDEAQPAFLVNVYSSQSDFAQGIVRVDVAVRPVRAMDYVYAAVTVKAY